MGSDCTPRPRKTYRKPGLFRRNRVLLAAAGECSRPVEIRKATMQELALEAAHRGLALEDMIGDLLDAIARDDLTAAVLDK